jgi:hypothetical protein
MNISAGTAIVIIVINVGIPDFELPKNSLMLSNN